MRHWWLLGLALGAGRLHAQVWNDSTVRTLVGRAIERRQRAEADSSLLSYRASGRGVVTFLAEIGSAGAPARLVKGDELAVEVYWQRPDRSKQIIRGWRDSTFFPTEIEYHRDHLGILTNDFGPEIRIGDGDEVLGVMHPLAPGAATRYDYAVRDTVRIDTLRGRLLLIAIDVKPKDPSTPAVIGSIFLDAGRAILVRSQLTFTRAAYRDGDLEDIAVRLDRSLVDGRYWLPVHQEIEIRRRVRLVDFPMQSVIRGRWDLDDYEINPRLDPKIFAGPAIGGLLRPGGSWPWPAPLARAVDSSLGRVDREALASIRRSALRVARARMLDGLPWSRFRLEALSSLARFNRVQGLALGLGVESRQLGWLDQAALSLGAGTSDGRVTGSIDLERRVGSFRLHASGSRRIADVADLPASSGVIGSLAAQELGRDYGDYVLVERIGLGLEKPLSGGMLAIDAGREWAWSVGAAAAPAHGTFRPNPALGDGGYWVGSATVVRSGQSGTGASWRARATLEAGAGSGTTGYLRWAGTGDVTRPLGGGELSLFARAGLGTAGLPARRTFVLGGRSTLPGTPFRIYGGRVAALVRATWLFRIPGPGLGLGSLGGTGREAWIGPLIAAGGAGGADSRVPWQPSGGVRPVVGVAAELFARTIRIELGQALRGGYGPGLTIDFTRQWWHLL